MWSSDYPHPVSSWPHSRTMVEKMFDGVDPHERELIVSGNARASGTSEPGWAMMRP